ncbi:antibiotic biosynthesis monooxygenase [Flagellimonas sp. HMM57]|uniref:antibiotic biosynthesis monooxygenase family protein n=1 Tax=unclassified Flagellimonas TaxID=2644544 RepID=UPI0013D7B8B0|nr:MULTISPECIES: antibiotic biosynthesis monooxygenase [unclassified Flagellimonas]UII77881.1 antibiotic biosynthesis monooxygenase [Flagellimonas sp. HMM57]
MELQKPYYAVIFTSTRTEGDNAYVEMAIQMEELARQQPGFIGVESARDGLGITVSYWENLKAIANWKANIDHKVAQNKGIKEWYSWYKVRVCLVEREYEFTK